MTSRDDTRDRPDRRSLVAITGMHRSGTSLATRVVQLAGLSLGREEGIAPPGRDNPAGYWENRYLTELHDEVLSALGGSWDQPPVLAGPWADDPALDPFRERLLALLDEYLPDEGRPVGAKDPRLSLLLPFWRTVVDVPTTIVVVRDPVEVAASLGDRNGMAAPQAALLWLRYVLAAVDHDPGHLLLSHRELFDDLPATVHRITRHLGLPAPTPEVTAAGQEHVDPSLRHHDARTSPVDTENPVVALAVAVWDGGRLDPATLPRGVVDGIVQGWLRPPADTEALDLARAKVVELQETLRKRNRRERAQASGAPTPAP